MQNREEMNRRKIVNLIFAVYWLVMFEGVLRKWIFPGLNKELFFLKDAVLLTLYWQVLRCNMMPKGALWKFGVFLGGLGLIILSMQATLPQLNVPALMYGWRLYFFYIPLAFIIRDHFIMDDLTRLIRQTLIVAIPISVLCFLQYISPPGSFINRSVEEGVYFTESGAGGTTIRVTGTFTFFHGFQMYLASLVVMLLSTWLLPKEKRAVKGVLLYMVMAAVCVTFALDFTRLPIFLSIFVVAGSLWSVFLIKDKSVIRKALVLPVALAIIGSVFIIGTVFSKANEIRMERFRYGDIAQRGEFLYSAFFKVLSHATYLGKGLGYTSRGSDYFVESEAEKTETGKYEVLTYEEEWPRIIIEAGLILGILFIIFRIFLSIDIIIGAVKSTAESDNPFPLLLACYIVPVILVWYIAHIGHVNSYGWLFAGFSLAANKLLGRQREFKTP